MSNENDIITNFISTYSNASGNPLDGGGIYQYVWDRYDGNQPARGDGEALDVNPGIKELFWHVYSDLSGPEIMQAQGGSGEDHYLGGRDVLLDGKDKIDDGYLWIIDYEPGVDKLIFPFKSSTRVDFDGTFLSFETPDSKTDKVFRLGNGGYDPNQVSGDIAFLDTFSDGVITKKYSFGSTEGGQQAPPTPNTDQLIISAPDIFGPRNSDIVTNYNPKTDSPIQIDLASFEGATGKLKIAKKSRKATKLAKKNIDFIYDRQAGYLYYNENGKQAGFGDGGIFAILEESPMVGIINFNFM